MAAPSLGQEEPEISQLYQGWIQILERRGGGGSDKLLSIKMRRSRARNDVFSPKAEGGGFPVYMRA